jgi:hypothetical protein
VPQITGVVSDLDGTLLGSDGVLSAATMRVLGFVRDVGVPLVVATARTPRAVRKIVGHEHLGRVVCANGAIVWDAGRNEVVRESCFDPEALTRAVAAVRAALPEAGVALLSASAMFVDNVYRALRRKGGEGAEVFTDVSTVLSTGERIAMVAVRDPRLSAEQTMRTISAAFGEIGMASFAGLGTVDIAPRTTTKAGAVAEEMAGTGSLPEGTVAFGDMPNDLPLFAWSGWACAVANGHPSVLEAADEIVPSNDEDGVARTIHRLLGR